MVAHHTEWSKVRENFTNFEDVVMKEMISFNSIVTNFVGNELKKVIILFLFDKFKWHNLEIRG